MTTKTHYGALEEKTVKDSDEKEQPGCFVKFFRFWFPDGTTTELITILSLGWPTILTVLFRFMMQSVSVIMCGHLSKYELNTAALSNSLINVLGLNIGNGLATACDTLFSQTYGSENKKGVGIFLQRALLCQYAIYTILVALHLNMEALLILLGQNPLIARMCQTYTNLFLPGLFADFTFVVVSKYLQCQNKVIPPMLCALGASVFNAISQYVAIFVFKYRYEASAICQMVSFCIMCISTIIYTIASGSYKETWPGLSCKDALCGWGLYYRYAIPGLFVIALEAWSYEISTIVAGTMGVIQLGAQAIIFQFDMWGFMIPFGLSIAVNIRVGQELGAGNPKAAQHVYRVAISTILVIATIISIIILSFKNLLPRIFTNNLEIANLAANILPIFALFIYFDGLAHISSGALRGCGRQIHAAVVAFIGFYVVGMPIGLPLGLLTYLKVYGLWIGSCVGVFTEAFINCVLVIRSDWAKESEKAIENAFSTASSQSSKGNSSANEDREEKETDPLQESKQKKLKEKKKIPKMLKAINKAKKTESFDREIIHRIIFLVIILGILAGGISLRIFQPRPWRDTCMPFANHTVVHNVSSAVCQEAILEGLASQAHPIAIG